MKENFKKFVKANPKLIEYVHNNNTSWQKLYEIYILYGEDEKVWNDYITSKNQKINELINIIKKLNLESIKNGVDSLQKAISILQEMTSKTKDESEIYEKRKKYEDLDD